MLIIQINWAEVAPDNESCKQDKVRSEAEFSSLPAQRCLPSTSPSSPSLVVMRSAPLGALCSLGSFINDIITPPVHSPSSTVSGYIPVTTVQKFPSGRSGPSFGPLVENKQKTSASNTFSFVSFFHSVFSWHALLHRNHFNKSLDDVKISNIGINIRHKFRTTWETRLNTYLRPAQAQFIFH